MTRVAGEQGYELPTCDNSTLVSDWVWQYSAASGDRFGMASPPRIKGAGPQLLASTSAQVQQLRGALQFLCLQVRFTDIVPSVSGSSCYFPDLALPQLDSLTVLGEQVYQGVDQLGLQDLSPGPAATHPQPP